MIGTFPAVVIFIVGLMASGAPAPAGDAPGLGKAGGDAPEPDRPRPHPVGHSPATFQDAGQAQQSAPAAHRVTLSTDPAGGTPARPY